MKRYFIKIAYDGSEFCGWQTQPNERTVQDVLENALKLILKHKELKTVGCGRTDSGVHASCFYAHFDMENAIKDKKKLVYKLNSFLPSSIAVSDLYEVNGDAHARFDAVLRTYHYFIHHSKDPFHTKYSYYLKNELNLEKMNKAAEYLITNDDFTSFSKIGSDNKTTICKVTVAKWENHGKQIRFSITADRFLRNMVRAIVGTMIEVGSGKISIDDFQKIIKSKSRQEAGTSAPANALFLTDVKYPYPLA